ncbi:MAG: hypothetical protein R2710_23760 [Acidimicrobiales bacterium]
MAAVERAIEAGREPRIIGETTVETLRNAFLASMGAPLTQLSETARKASTELADKLGPATITRSLEMLGQALVDMRQAPDQRVPLEVALLRLSRRDGADTAGLLQRIEQLEAQIAALAAGGVAAAPSTAPSGPAPQPAPTAPVPEAPAATRSATPAAPPPPSGAPPPPARRSAPAPTSPPASGGPADLARANLAETLNASAASAPASPSDATATPAPAATPPAAAPTPAPPPAPTPAAAAPSGTTKPFSIGTRTAALDAGLLDSVSQRARVRFAAASPTAADDGAGTATFAVPNNYYLRVAKTSAPRSRPRCSSTSVVRSPSSSRSTTTPQSGEATGG